jgi:hypothetical protein
MHGRGRKRTHIADGDFGTGILAVHGAICVVGIHVGGGRRISEDVCGGRTRTFDCSVPARVGVDGGVYRVTRYCSSDIFGLW